MPQKRPFGTPEEEIEAFARRMIHAVEELDYANNRQAWLQFVSDKMWDTRGMTLTDRQLQILDEGRFSVIDMWGEAGFKRELPFVTRPQQIRYRDLTTGRFTSKAAVTVNITGLIKRGVTR